MSQSFRPSDFIIPETTSAVLLPLSWQPWFVRNSTKFQRAAYDPRRMSLVTERLDPNNRSDVFKYNEYLVVATSTGTLLSGPLPTRSTFIPHHLSHPSTWLSSLSYVSTG